MIMSRTVQVSLSAPEGCSSGASFVVLAVQGDGLSGSTIPPRPRWSSASRFMTNLHTKSDKVSPILCGSDEFPC